MKHRRAWCRFWCAYASNNGITNFFAYNMYEGCACLEAVHQRAEQLAKEKGAKAQHASFKEARAAMSAFWGLVHPDTNFAEVRAVKAMAKGLRRVAPLKAKHADTWDIQLVFDKLFELARRGIRVVDMDHDKMRGWLALMLKIKTAGRSGDVGFVRSGDRGGLYRGFYPRDTNKMRCGLRGDWLEPHVTHVRWYMNKTVAGQADDYSPWHPLGDHLEDSRAFPFLSAACPRRMLEAYLDKTDTLPRSDDLVLISSVKKDGRYFGITAQTVANDVGAVMTVCGVAARFNAHTTRHASLSKRRAGGASIDDIVGSANISATVFKNFYNRPIDKAAAAPPPSLGGKGTRRLAPARAMALTTSKRPSSAIVVSKKTKKKKKIQQKKIEPAAPPAAAAACVIDIVLRDEPVFCDAGHANDIKAYFCTAPGCDRPVCVTGSRVRRPSSLAAAPPPANPTSKTRRHAPAPRISPPPSAEEVYDVDFVLDVADTGENKTCPLYRVRWVGYGEDDDSWLSATQLDGAAALLDAFRHAREMDTSLSERRLATRPPRRAPALTPSSPHSHTLGILASSASWLGAPVPDSR